MKNFLLALIVPFLFASCTSSDVKDASFDVSVDDMTAAILSFRKTDDHLLFLHLVDRNGNIVKSKVIESKNNRLSKKDIKDIRFLLSRKRKYEPAKPEDPDYRSIFNSTKHRSSGYYSF